jgi:hypothetical protein
VRAESDKVVLAEKLVADLDKPNPEVLVPQPQAHFKLQSKNFFDLAHGQSPGWQADPPFRRERLLAIVLSSALSACGNHSGEAERDSGIGLKLFGFIAEPVFTFNPESCSGSARKAVRNHPGIAFILPRIPHSVGARGLEPPPPCAPAKLINAISLVCLGLFRILYPGFGTLFGRSTLVVALAQFCTRSHLG